MSASRDDAPAGASRPRLVAAGVSVALDAVTAEVTSAFARADIRTILLKGPAVISWLYSQQTDRFSTDVDLLVGPADNARAEEVLRGLGFEAADALHEERHARAWVREPQGIVVDLHRRLVGIRLPREAAWRVLTEETEALEVSGARVDVLRREARALHLALHAAQQLPDKEKPLRDLARALDVLPFELWLRAHGLAQRLDAVPAFAGGLRLLSAGEAVADQLALPRATSVEVALRARAAPDLSLGLAGLAQMRGARSRAAFVLRKLFPSPTAMHAWRPLARRGKAGLAAAYVWRVGWVAARLGPAAAAVLAARRRARSSADA